MRLFRWGLVRAHRRGLNSPLIHFVASELKDPIWHSSEWQIGSFSSEATTYSFSHRVYELSLIQWCKVTLGAILQRRSVGENFNTLLFFAWDISSTDDQINKQWSASDRPIATFLEVTESHCTEVTLHPWPSLPLWRNKRTTSCGRYHALHLSGTVYFRRFQCSWQHFHHFAPLKWKGRYLALCKLRDTALSFYSKIILLNTARHLKRNHI